MVFRFSVDDTILILKELTLENYNSIFEHPYLKFYKDLHSETGLKVQFNLFYKKDNFCLADMTEKFKQEFKDNADWIQFSFHSLEEPSRYKDTSYDEIKADCEAVQREIIRFSSPENLNPITTLHYCACTQDGGVRALRDCGIKGLIGLFGTEEKLRISYDLSEELCRKMQRDSFYYDEKMPMWYIRNDMVINNVELEDIEGGLSKCLGQEFVEIMIHEQFFFKDYPMYYDEKAPLKVKTAVEFLIKNGYKPAFLDEVLLK